MSSLLWCNQQLVVTIEDPGGRRSFTVPKPYARAGAHPNAEIHLPGVQVPRRAFYLHATNQGIYLVDLVHPDGALSGWLRPTQPIRIADYTLWVELSDADRVEPPTEPLEQPGGLEPPRPLLALYMRDQLATLHTLGRRLTLLGRHRPSSMRITSRLISATHCVLYCEQGRLWVVDLLSTNGTWINGRRIEVAELPLGSAIEIGTLRVVHSPYPESFVADTVRHDGEATTCPPDAGASVSQPPPLRDRDETVIVYQDARSDEHQSEQSSATDIYSRPTALSEPVASEALDVVLADESLFRSDQLETSKDSLPEAAKRPPTNVRAQASVPKAVPNASQGSPSINVGQPTGKADEAGDSVVKHSASPDEDNVVLDQFEQQVIDRLVEFGRQKRLRWLLWHAAFVLAAAALGALCWTALWAYLGSKIF